MTYVVPQIFKTLALLVSQQNMDVFGVTLEEKNNAFGEHVMLTVGNRDKADLVQVKTRVHQYQYIKFHIFMLIT